MKPSEVLQQQLSGFREDYQQLKEQIAKILVGHESATEAVLTALLAGGHVLLEGPPGVGKTLLGRTLAEVFELDYRRIQFTSDMMPADITGTYIVMESQGRRKFEFQEGPIFTNLLLADEINRATPKTQAALLEAMDERTVTMANEVYELPTPFFVVATQSSDGSEGTFPLPENQLDRFFALVHLSMPNLDDLETIFQRSADADPPKIDRSINADRVAEMAHVVRQVSIADDIRRYSARIIWATHATKAKDGTLASRFVQRGVGPRGGQAMIMAAKVRAILDDRTYVAREDIVDVGGWTLSHRLALNFDGHAEGIDSRDIIQETLDTVKRTES